jgi:hypothetical protein
MTLTATLPVPLSCMTAIHRRHAHQVRFGSICTSCCVRTIFDAYIRVCPSVLQTRATVTVCAWSHSIRSASATSSTPVCVASVAPLATRTTRHVRKCRGARNFCSSTSHSNVLWHNFETDFVFGLRTPCQLPGLVTVSPGSLFGHSGRLSCHHTI